MGLAVTGFEIGRDGVIRVLTGAEIRDAAEAALAGWEKTNGKNA